jgi:transcriptional regulator with XRE-family HTH domain
MTKSKVSRLEIGATELSVEAARLFAHALGVPLSHLLGEHEAEQPRIGNDLAPAVLDPTDPLAALRSATCELWTVTSNVLDRANMPPGTLLQVGTSRAAIARVRQLQAVVVRLHAPQGFVEPVMLLRQFVPPRLLIANSSDMKIANIDMDELDARIIGVVEGFYQRTA